MKTRDEIKVVMFVGAVLGIVFIAVLWGWI